MSFLQPEFAGFFAVVCAVYWVLPAARWQNVWLLLASWLFYGWVSPVLLVLLLSVTLANYGAARLIDRFPARGGQILGALTAASVANLAVFKYFGWFTAEIAPKFFSPERTAAIDALHVVMPLGLSFYTFHNLSYSIDVRRKAVAVRTDVLDVLLFGSYFPQLVAGPIERAEHIFPQIDKKRSFEATRFLSGLALALWGAFQKVVIADTLAPYVDLIFGADHASWAMIWAGTLGFALQVLADFAGYTAIARGTSRMLGIELVENFNHPYLAATPTEFWQRWHISLSSWLRDYVYFPLCFSRSVQRWLTIPGTGKWRPSANSARALLITMLLSGLWHGSTPKFLLWGLYHFVLITTYITVERRLPKHLRDAGGWRWLTVPLMFCWTLVSMLIWREPTAARIAEHLKLNPFAENADQLIVATSMLGLCAYAAAPLLFALAWERWLGPRVTHRGLQPVAWSVGCTAMALAILASAQAQPSAFVYFQF